MNEFLTAYLHTLYTLRGGRLSPSEAIDYVIGLASVAQKTKTTLVKILGFGRGDRHA